MWEGLGLAGPEVPAVGFFFGQRLYIRRGSRILDMYLEKSRSRWREERENHFFFFFIFHFFLFFFVFYFFTALRDWHTQDILKLVPNYLIMTDDTS